jgi:hypothetical protein
VQFDALRSRQVFDSTTFTFPPRSGTWCAIAVGVKSTTDKVEDSTMIKLTVVFQGINGEDGEINEQWFTSRETAEDALQSFEDAFPGTIEQHSIKCINEWR